MAIALAVVGYLTVSGLVVMFFRFTNERDEMMHTVTARWIEETHA